MGAEWDSETRAGRRTVESVWSDRGRGPDRLALSAHLKSAHGFLVDTTDGRELGVVDDVILDEHAGVVAELDVRGGWFGRRHYVVTALGVRDIFPELRRLVVDPASAREIRG